MAPFNIPIFLNVWGTFFLLQHKIFRHVPLIYNPKLKIFLNFEDDDNYDEEGDNKPEKNITPKECLEAFEKVRAYCQLHDFQNSVHYSRRMIENDCVKATYHQSNIQKHICNNLQVL